MDSGLVSYRMIFVAAKENGTDRWHPDHEIWREAASLTRVPIEFSAHDAIAAKATLSVEKIDFCVLDARLPDGERSLVLSDTLSIPQRPTVILAGLSAQLTPGVDFVFPAPPDPKTASRLVNLALGTKEPCRALIVDDSSIMRAIVRKVLAGSKFAFQVAEASDGMMALEMMSDFRAAIVFLDVNMPGMSGFDVLAHIRRDHLRAAVVMMSSASNNEIADRAHGARALAFLRKPFYAEDVDTVLEGYYRHFMSQYARGLA